MKRKRRRCRGCSKIGGKEFCKRCVHLRRKFGIHPRSIHQMERAQNGQCAVCRRTPSAQHLSVDYDHQTNVVRGMVCVRCLIALGMFSTKVLLFHALRYLNRTQPALTPIHVRPAPRISAADHRVVQEALDAPTGTLRAVARHVSEVLGISFDAALSRVRREANKRRGCRVSTGLIQESDTPRDTV